MEQEHNMLSFTVNESLYMEAGQGMEEMLAISLEPDIAIETFHDYVQIRGIIILQGECKKATNDPKGKELEENQLKNYVEKIIDTEPNQAMFSHRFPVEISVPKDRIPNMADVKVEVVSFDYELPSTHLLNIEATLHIHGISADRVVQEAPKEVQESPLEAPKAVEDTPLGQDATQKEIEPVLDVEEKAESEVVRESPDRAEANQSSEPAEANEALEAQKFEEIQEAEKVQERTTPREHAPDTERHIVETDHQTIDIQLSENEGEEADEKVKDVLFLTDLFGGVSEESVTTMRIHIVQEEDTVESIAKRYEMSTLQLMKDNQLVADEMTPGKLVYIDV